MITLSLETPKLSNSTPTPKPKSTTTTSVTTVKGKAAEKKAIARVALVKVSQANIYSKQSTSSRVYSTCRKDTPLAVLSTSKSWYGVLMADGSTGWIQESKVDLLDYTTALPPTARGQYASRGGFDRDASDNPIVQTALQYLGVPYVYGGNSTSSGIDCSAFVKTVYAQFGVNLPRVSRDQAKVGTPIAPEDIQPGDRLYFACKHSYVDHCGMYIGNGYFIHASASRGGVAVDNLTAKFYSNSLVAIMR